MMAIDSEASGLALPKTYDQNIGAHNRNPFDPTIYRHQTPKGDRWGRAFRNSSPTKTKRECNKQRNVLAREVH
jgi:hypothetical protein